MSQLIVLPVSSLEKVFADQAPAAHMRVERLCGLKGECLSFQLAYFWKGVRRSYARVCLDSPLGGTVRVRAVKSVPVQYPCHPQVDGNYLRTSPGLYPDLLCELRPEGIALISGQWQSLWVDVETDEHSEAGSYPLSIGIYDGKDCLGSVSVTVEILPAVLPELPIPHTEWFHTDCLCNYYGFEPFSEAYWDCVGNFVKTAVRRDINMIYTPIFTPPLDTAVGGERRTIQLVEVSLENGRYQFSYERLERWLQVCREAGVRYLEISHLFSQWGAAYAPKIMVNEGGKRWQKFGWHTPAQSEEYRDFLQALLPSLTAYLRAYWEAERIYFHVSDEPTREQLPGYQAAAGLVKPYLRGFKMIDALSDYEFYRSGAVEIPVCSNNHIGPFLENRPRELWSYYCTAQYLHVSNRFMAMPSSRNRIYGWQLYKYHIDGILHWGYNFYNSVESLYPISPYLVTDADGAFPAGDPFLVYPGTGGKPEESIRMMVHAEAMADLRALYLLERRLGRERVLKELDLSALAFDCCQDALDIMSWRDKLNDMLREHCVE